MCGFRNMFVPTTPLGRVVLALVLPCVAAGSAAPLAPEVCTAHEGCEHAPSVCSSLFQASRQQQLSGRQQLVNEVAGDLAGEQCTKISNQGTFFTASLLFGSKKQKVDVLVDTGSTALVVADCLCESCGLTKKECVDAAGSSSYKTNCVHGSE